MNSEVCVTPTLNGYIELIHVTEQPLNMPATYQSIEHNSETHVVSTLHIYNYIYNT